MERRAAEVQQHGQTIENADRRRTDELLDWLRAAGSDSDSSAFDVALVLKSIANTDAHPAPKALGGVDLKYVWTVL